MPQMVTRRKKRKDIGERIPQDVEYSRLRHIAREMLADLAKSDELIKSRARRVPPKPNDDDDYERGDSRQWMKDEVRDSRRITDKNQAYQAINRFIRLLEGDVSRSEYLMLWRAVLRLRRVIAGTYTTKRPRGERPPKQDHELVKEQVDMMLAILRELDPISFIQRDNPLPLYVDA